MNFTIRELYNKKFSLLDIGTYKIRSLTAKLDIEDIEIIGYSEKRQEEENFLLGEVENIKEITENIATCLSQSQKENEVEDIITNTLSPFSFLYSHHINHIRKSPLSLISEEEVFSVVKEFEQRCFKEALVDIEFKSAYKKDEIKSIFSSILDVRIDGKKVSSLFGKTGKNIKISLVNIFIPTSYYQLTKEIFHALGKDSIITIPFEYSILRYFPQESVVLINLGNTKTYIGIKKDDDIIGTTRINIGMNDLIKKIKERHPLIPLFQIVHDIDSPLWEEEKKEFLEILHFCIAEGIKEILGTTICPHQFFFFGGGGNNEFIKKSFETLDTHKFHLKMVKKIENVPFPHFGKSDSTNFLQSTSNLDLLTTILTYEEREEKKNDILTKQLTKVIEEIEASRE